MNGEAVLGLTKVAFMERWPSYREATINGISCIYMSLHAGGWSH